MRTVVPKARISSGVQGHVPRKIFEIGLSVTPFPAFPGPISCESTGPYMSNDRTLRPASGRKRNPCKIAGVLEVKLGILL